MVIETEGSMPTPTKPELQTVMAIHKDRLLIIMKMLRVKPAMQDAVLLRQKECLPVWQAAARCEVTSAGLNKIENRLVELDRDIEATYQ